MKKEKKVEKILKTMRDFLQRRVSETGSHADSDLLSEIKTSRVCQHGVAPQQHAHRPGPRRRPRVAPSLLHCSSEDNHSRRDTSESHHPPAQRAGPSPGAHVPAAVSGVVAQAVQHCEVDLGHVLSAHNLVRVPFCPHTDGLADPGSRSVKQLRSAHPARPSLYFTPFQPDVFSLQDTTQTRTVTSEWVQNSRVPSC